MKINLKNEKTLRKKKRFNNCVWRTRSAEDGILTISTPALLSKDDSKSISSRESCSVSSDKTRGFNYKSVFAPPVRRWSGCGKHFTAILFPFVKKQKTKMTTKHENFFLTSAKAEVRAIILIGFLRGFHK